LFSTYVNPWVDDRVAEIENFGYQFFLVGFAIGFFPAMSLLGTCFRPCLPREVDEFFSHPDYEKRPKKKNKKELNESDEEEISEESHSDEEKEIEREEKEIKKEEKEIKKRRNRI